MITSLPKKLFSLTFDNQFRVLPAQEQSELLLGATLPWMSKCIGRILTKQYDYKTDNVESLIIARSCNDNSVSNVISLVLSYILQTPILGLTQEWFRAVSLSRLARGVYDKFTPCGIFYFLCLLHRHRIEGTNMLYNVSSERHMQSKRICPRFEAALQQVSYHIPQELLLVKFLHLYNMPGPRIEPRTTKYKAYVITGHRDKHYTTVPPTAIMMNITHADIHQMVIKPVGISHVYAIRHRYGLSDVYN